MTSQLSESQRAAADAVWTHACGGAAPDPAIFTGMDLDDGLVIQADVLRRRLAEGAELIGWKVGFTSDRARRAVGSDDRPFGHLLRLLPSGAGIGSDDAISWSLEPEMCLTMGEPLQGSDVTAERAAASVDTVAAGFEINERRVDIAGSLALLVADNLTNWAIVEGSGVPAHDVAAIDDTIVTLSCNGTERFSCRSGDEVDTPFASVARLAATLDRVGLGLEAGQKIITGAYTRERPSPGETWQARYSDIGDVEVSAL